MARNTFDDPMSGGIDMGKVGFHVVSRTLRGLNFKPRVNSPHTSDIPA